MPAPIIATVVGFETGSELVDFETDLEIINSASYS